ncbi:MAG: TlpA family protein disulfide reductase, partial [Myxococcales bacterium]|nr:TlpA family protein disulfide reductase [Myxococcales bacterium]
LAVNGWTLGRRGDFRESVLLATPGRPLTLSGRRGRTPFNIELPAPPMPLPVPPPLLGEVVGELRLRPLDAAQGLPAIGEGRPAVLFYWATWCKPCKAALPLLQTWAQTHDVPVVAITDEGPAVIHRFLNTFGSFPFPIALDSEGEARRLFGVDSLPVFVLLDAGRRLTQLEVGFDAAIPLAPPPT